MDTVVDYFGQVEKMLQEISLPHLNRIFALLEQAYHDNRHIFIMGNGGSAATASHLALDLAKNTIMADVPRIKVLSLTDHTPLITAWSNDTAYDNIFTEQLSSWLEPGDVVLGISASGNSPNIVQALQYARASRAVTIGLLGARGGKAREIVDAYILAPGQNIEQEEDAHMILAHIITRHMREVVRSTTRHIMVALPVGKYSSN